MEKLTTLKPEVPNNKNKENKDYKPIDRDELGQEKERADEEAMREQARAKENIAKSLGEEHLENLAKEERIDGQEKINIPEKLKNNIEEEKLENFYKEFKEIKEGPELYQKYKQISLKILLEMVKEKKDSEKLISNLRNGIKGGGEKTYLKNILEDANKSRGHKRFYENLGKALKTAGYKEDGIFSKIIGKNPLKKLQEDIDNFLLSQVNEKDILTIKEMENIAEENKKSYTTGSGRITITESKFFSEINPEDAWNKAKERIGTEKRAA